MSKKLPEIYLARHGETAWSRSKQHTGLTDLPLTTNGEKSAQGLGGDLRAAGNQFSLILTSPLRRAKHTAELAGYGSAISDSNLVEWDYGDYEGKTSAEILELNPNWKLFRDGCPGGESVADVTHRADQVIARLRAHERDALLFSSGHFLRVLGARWIGLPAAVGQKFLVDTAAYCNLSYEHNLTEPAIRLWNVCRPH